MTTFEPVTIEFDCPPDHIRAENVMLKRGLLFVPVTVLCAVWHKENGFLALGVPITRGPKELARLVTKLQRKGRQQFDLQEATLVKKIN